MIGHFVHLDIQGKHIQHILNLRRILVYSWDLAEFYIDLQKTIKLYLCKFGGIIHHGALYQDDINSRYAWEVGITFDLCMHVPFLYTIIFSFLKNYKFYTHNTMGISGQ